MCTSLEPCFTIAMAVVGVSHMRIGVPVPMTRFITRRGDVGDGWGSFGVRGRYASGMAFTIFYFLFFYFSMP